MLTDSSALYAVVAESVTLVRDPDVLLTLEDDELVEELLLEELDELEELLLDELEELLPEELEDPLPEEFPVPPFDPGSLSSGPIPGPASSPAV